MSTLNKLAAIAPKHNYAHQNGDVGYRRLSSEETPILIEEETDEIETDQGKTIVAATATGTAITVELGKPTNQLNGIKRKRAIGFENSRPNNNYGSILSNDTASLIRQRKISRTISKKGGSNLTPKNIESDGWPFLADIFTTVLEMSWTYILVTFCFAYFASWLFFAALWYSIVYYHGDLDPVNVANVTWEPCISEFKDFTSAFLFSVETQHTTGYGYYHLTELCPAAVMTLCAQSIFGCILEGIMVGLLFVKISRAKKRSRTLMFSRTAVISQRDGQLCFMFRVADMRKSHLLGATIRAEVISKRTTTEGEEITISQEELDVGGDGEKFNRLLLFWPTTIVHRINSSSPLYKASAAVLNPDNTNFEIIVVLEGTVEATGLITQAKSSYMPHEILWGHRFKNITSSKSKNGDRVVDYSLFHETLHVPTSPLSAQQLDTLSYNTSVSEPQLVELATSLVTKAVQDSFQQIRSYK